MNAEYFPSFLRFGKIDIYILTLSDEDDENEGIWDTQLIAEKCQLFEDQLKLIKPALDGSIMKIDANIDQDNPYCFDDHYELLKYLSDRFLPICDKSRGYEFWIGFDSDANTAKCIISAILKLEQVDRCSNLTFWLSTADRTKLPIKEISHWLHRSGGEQQERSLYIHLSEIKSLVDVFTRLKTVFSCNHNTIQNK